MSMSFLCPRHMCAYHDNLRHMRGIDTVWDTMWSHHYDLRSMWAFRPFLETPVSYYVKCLLLLSVHACELTAVSRYYLLVKNMSDIGIVWQIMSHTYTGLWVMFDTGISCIEYWQTAIYQSCQLCLGFMIMYWMPEPCLWRICDNQHCTSAGILLLSECCSIVKPPG